MRIERLGEKAVILRDLPCPAFELARILNELPHSLVDADSSGTHHRVTENTEFHREPAVKSLRSPLHRGECESGGFEEAVASYETVGLYFSKPVASPDGLLASVSKVIGGPINTASPEPKLIQIPVCYELGPDLAEAAKSLQIPTEELIELHLGTDYRCYAVGFSPGFAYLGYLNDRIASLPRLSSPRPRVEPGSVGITGRQTAVYPSSTPGGWNLIGKCPLTLVDVKDNYFPIEAGDQIRFVRIDDQEFAKQEGERL